MSRRKNNKKNIYVPNRLLNELEKIFEYPLTVLYAKSGCGKTTAITEFLNRQDGLNYVYTDLNHSPKKSWITICETFNIVDKQIGEKMKKFISPTKNDMMSLANLIFDVDCNKPTMILLDNYQVASFSGADSFITLLAEHNSSNLHIVVITEQLPVDMHNIHNKYNIHIIHEPKFYFFPSDIKLLFESYGININNEQANEVFNISCGIACNIIFQVYWYVENYGFFDSQSTYRLIENIIWNKLLTTQQNFLMSLSLYNKFTINMLDGILPPKKSKEQCQKFLNGFWMIHFDIDTGTYTIHNIFRKFLVDKFESTSNDFKNITLKSVANILKNHSKNIEAAEIFLKIKDYESFLSVSFNSQELTKFVYTDNIDIQDIVENCSPEILFKYPNQLITLTLELLVHGRFSQFEILFEYIDLFLTSSGISDNKVKQEVLGRQELINSILSFNNIPKIVSLHKKAFEFLEIPNELFSNLSTWAFGIPSVMCLYWREVGKLSETLIELKECLKYYNKCTKGHGMGGDVAMQAEILLMMGKDDVAEALCHKAIYIASCKEQDSISFCAQLTLARIAILRGDVESLVLIMQNIKKQGFYGNELSSLTCSQLCESFVSSLLGKNETIPTWIYEQSELECRVYYMGMPYVQIIRSKLFIEKNDPQFIKMMNELCIQSDTMNMAYPKLYYLIHMTIWAKLNSTQQEALDYLNQALKIAIPDKVYMPIAEHYEFLSKLLLSKDLACSDDKRLNDIITLGKRMASGIKKIRKNLMPEKAVLAPREREIAMMVQQGLSAKQIAVKMSLSVATVRTVMRTIYSKLEVHSKAQLIKKQI